MDSLKEWVTLGAAITAAATSTISLWRGLFDKDDKIKVSFGTIHPQTGPGYGLHVTSRADHVMTVNDYGFFDRRGRLLSMPDMLAENECDDEICSSGSTLMEKRGATYELAYVVLRDAQIGAYAKTTGQDRPTICFRPSVRWHLRLRLWLRIKWLEQQFQ